MMQSSCQKQNPRDGGATFPLSNRLWRLTWSLVWGAFGSWTPVPFHGWRRFLVRAFGGQIDKTAKIYPHVSIWDPSRLEMQARSCLGQHVICYSMDRVILGPYALISQYAYLCCGTHDINNPAFPLQTAPISIQRNAWVAAGAFVGPGVHVGEGAVLGARAVTVKSLEDWGVYVGNPAHKVNTRKPF